MLLSIMATKPLVVTAFIVPIVVGSIVVIVIVIAIIVAITATNYHLLLLVMPVA